MVQSNTEDPLFNNLLIPDSEEENTKISEITIRMNEAQSEYDMYEKTKDVMTDEEIKDFLIKQKNTLDYFDEQYDKGRMNKEEVIRYKKLKEEIDKPQEKLIVEEIISKYQKSWLINNLYTTPWMTQRPRSLGFVVENKERWDVDSENLFSDKQASDIYKGDDIVLFDFKKIKDIFFTLGKVSNYTGFIKMLRNRFSEFVFNPLLEGRATRKKFGGNKRVCCVIDTSFYYDYGAKIKIKTFNKDLKTQFFTCHPITKEIGNHNYCDDIYIEYCIYENKENYKNLNIPFALKDKCKVWFLGFLQRQPPEYEEILKYIEKKCSKEIDNKCIDFLNVFLTTKDKDLFELKDIILKRQDINYKRLNLKCSFPSNLIKSREKYIIEPRQCWDNNCVYSEGWKLLTYDIVKKSKCKYFNCNISFDYINENIDGKLKISCDTNKNITNNNPIIEYRKILSEFCNAFMITNFSLILIIIFILLLINSFINKNKKTFLTKKFA